MFVLSSAMSALQDKASARARELVVRSAVDAHASDVGVKLSSAVAALPRAAD